MPCLLKHHTNCFPDLTADICPRDCYDPIDDQRIRKMAKMRPCKPLCVQLGTPAMGPSLLPQCPLAMQNLNCPPSWPSGPQAFQNPKPTVYLHVSRHSRLDILVQPLFSCAAASWLRPQLMDQSIHAFFFCNTHPQVGGLPRWHLRSTDVRASYQAVPSLLISACQALPTALRQRVFAPLTHWS